MKSYASALLSAALALPFFSPCKAGEAVFSLDGKSIYCLKPQSATVLRMGMPHKPGDEPEVFDLSKAAGPDAKISSIVRTKDGSFLLAAKGQLLQWKPGSDPEKSGTAPEEHVIRDIAAQPFTGHLLAPCLNGDKEKQHPSLTTRDPEEKNLTNKESMPVNMTAPVFDGSGRLFFGVDACLCAGGLFKNDDDTTSFVSWPVAPLDAPSLDNGTSSDSLSITGIAPAGQWLYISLTSDVDCELIRLPVPEMKLKAGLLTAQPASTRKARWKRFSGTLNTIQKLESETQPYFSAFRGLCASPDGKTVFFAGVPVLHPEREEYWSIDVKSGERHSLGDRPLE